MPLLLTFSFLSYHILTNKDVFVARWCQRHIMSLYGVSVNISYSVTVNIRCYIFICFFFVFRSQKISVACMYIFLFLWYNRVWRLTDKVIIIYNILRTIWFSYWLYLDLLNQSWFILWCFCQSLHTILQEKMFNFCLRFMEVSRVWQWSNMCKL